MIITNIEYIPGRKITAQMGIVSGSTVRSKNAVKDFGASIKNFVGGELKAYTELLEESRKEAIRRMEHQAEILGADAVINVRFATSAITAGAAEIYVYGTAVKTEAE
jgi:uncharacterized protein YbjQ (UPF0145 family)